MANGFVTRTKGKEKIAALWLGKQAQNGVNSAASYSTAGTQTITPEAKVNLLTGSSGMAVFTLGFPPARGLEYNFIMAPTSGIMLAAQAGSAFDASTNTVLKSTYAMQVSLVGISTVAWRVKSVFPQSTAGVAPLSGITLTTTT